MALLLASPKPSTARPLSWPLRSLSKMSFRSSKECVSISQCTCTAERGRQHEHLHEQLRA